GISAGTVGVTDNSDSGSSVADQAFSKFVQHRPEVGFDFCAAGIERDIAGDFQLQTIVLGLRDLHASTGSCLLHFLLLRFHSLGPDVAGNGASNCADASTNGGALATARNGANYGTGAGTNGGALGSTFLRLGHI